MSHKSEADKTKEGYPWTARQQRRKASNRKSRKQARPGHSMQRAARKKKARTPK